VRISIATRRRIAWLLAVVVGVFVVDVVLSERIPKGADPKWELAIRSGMAFVSAEPVAAPPAPLPSRVQDLKYRVDALFLRAFLEPQEGQYLILACLGSQRWLKPRAPVDRWRALHLVVSPTQKTVLRCYPRFAEMTWYDADLYAESPTLEAGKWYQVRIFVRLFRQLTERPLRDFRIDIISPLPNDLRIADLYIEGEH
jgi:hypothetical protein